MRLWPKSSPYLIEGRLPDVLAAIQVMAAAKRPERAIKSWAKELDHKEDSETVDRWARVFNEHREFFLVYTPRGQTETKAALRWRYVYKHYDADSGETFTGAEIEELAPERRELLTTEPLNDEQAKTLVNATIELHSRAVAERALSLWWVPLAAAICAAIGAIGGTLLVAALGLKN